jgi:hypothetical protein
MYTNGNALCQSRLTPKGPSPFFSKNTPKSAILAQEAQMKKKSSFLTFNSRILFYTTRRTCSKSFKKIHHTDCKTITFEVERKDIFFLVPGRDNKV